LKLHRFIKLFFLLLFTFSCQTDHFYLKNRVEDLKDIITLGVEKESLGVSFWFWCLGGGLSYNASTKGIGMRGGTIGFYETGGHGNINILSADLIGKHRNRMGSSYLIQNSIQHRPMYRNSEREKGKSFDALNLLLLVPIPKQNQKDNAGCDAPLHLETSISFFYGIRLGLNLNELADFIFGVGGFDMLDDDE